MSFADHQNYLPEQPDYDDDLHNLTGKTKAAMSDPLRERLTALEQQMRDETERLRRRADGHNLAIAATNECWADAVAALRAMPVPEPVAKPLLKTVMVMVQQDGSSDWTLAAHFYDYDYFNRVEAALRAVPVGEGAVDAALVLRTCEVIGGVLAFAMGRTWGEGETYWAKRFDEAQEALGHLREAARAAAPVAK